VGRLGGPLVLNPSKTINIKKTMKNTNTNKLDTLPQLKPQFITGFSDAEGSFAITITKRKSGG